MAKYFINLLIGALLLGASAATPQNANPLPKPEARRTEKDPSGERSRRAKALLERALRADAALDLLMGAGLELVQSDMYEEAAIIFRRCVERYPDSFEARYNLALAEFATERFQSALAALSEARHLSPGQAPARDYLLGKIYEALGDPANAERHFVAAVASRPSEENYALDFGLFYIRRRQYAKAVAVLEPAGQSPSASTFVLLALSLSQALDGDRAHGIQHLRRILAQAPDSDAARLILAYALYVDGEYEQCIQAAEPGLRAGNGEPYLYYVHAAALLKMNSDQNGRMLGGLDKAIRSMPACALCYTARSKVYEQMGRVEDAIRDLEAVTQRLSR